MTHVLDKTFNCIPKSFCTYPERRVYQDLAEINNDAPKDHLGLLFCLYSHFLSFFLLIAGGVGKSALTIQLIQNQ